MPKANVLVGQRVFSESDLSPKKIFQHYCDDQIIVMKYLKNRTLNEMRRDLFFERQSDECETQVELIEMFTRTRNELKSRNKVLRKKGKDSLANYAKEYVDLEFLSAIPPLWKTIIVEARLLRDDGNEKELLTLSSDNNFYFLTWSGS